MKLGVALSPGSQSSASASAAQDFLRKSGASYSNGHSVFVDGTETVKMLKQSQINTLIRDSFTWAFWYRDTSISTGDLGGFNLSNAVSQAVRIRPIPVAPGVQFLQTVVNFNGVSTSATDSIGTALANDTWHHIALVVTKGGGGSLPGNVKVYIDGVQKSNFTGPVTTNQEAAAVQADTTWGVGSSIEDDGGGGGFVSAYFDEVAFWNTNLDADAITAIYNSGATFDLTSDNGNYDVSSSLQYYFRFENDYTDTQGNASNAATEGTPVFSTSPTPP